MAAYGTERPNTAPISDVLLYKTSIRDVDRTHGFAGVSGVLDELESRALNEDTKSLARLFEIFFISDGYVTEGVLASIGAVYKARPVFVLRTAHTYDSPKRDLIYKCIIFDVYYGPVFQGEYPSNVGELKGLGKQAARLLQMYDYYLKHPQDIEDWSVNPPE
ncbi:MAG: hypothetical protein OES46_18825 [Gammaproteobacteria bacterium]|nr:hypothetical protein [Gammaproteobacteria bacterium]